MSDKTVFGKDLFRAGNILNVISIAAMFIMAIWFFAVSSMRVDSNTNELKRQEVQINSNMDRLRQQEIMQAITTTQYEQILIRLDNISAKIEQE